MPLFSRFVRACLGVQTIIGNPQALYWPPVHKMLFHNLRGVRCRHAAVPYTLWIDHHRRAMLALIQASGLVDPHRTFEKSCLTRCPCTLLQLREQLALSIHSARCTRRVFRPAVLADKYMMLKNWQSKFPPPSD